MATDLSFFPGPAFGSVNPILNGFKFNIFILNRKKNQAFEHDFSQVALKKAGVELSN